MQNYTPEMEKAAAAIIGRIAGGLGRNIGKFTKAPVSTQNLVQAARNIKFPSANPALSGLRPQSFVRKLLPWAGAIGIGGGLGVLANKSGITDNIRNSITEAINR